MPQVIPPPPKPIETDIELFAKAYFNIELTDAQLQFMAMVAAGKKSMLIIRSRSAELTTASKVILAYLQEGMKIGGRARLPRYLLPPRDKLKGFSQVGKVVALLKRPQGAYNFELSRVALKYTSVISSLRRDGHNIPAPERQYLKNGKASNTFLYRLVGE